MVKLYEEGEVHFRLLPTNDFHIKPENERFAAASSRCRQNLIYENFMPLLGRLRQKCFIGRATWLFFLDHSTNHTRELKQPRRRQQQKRHKFAYLTMKNSIFARFARAFFLFCHFVDVLVVSTTWNDLFCRCVDDVSIWWQMLNFVFLCPKRWFEFNFRIVRTQFSSIMRLNNWNMIAETRGHIFGSRSRFRRRRVCLSSLRGSLRSTTRLQRRRHKICILNWQKQKFCTPFTCFF